MAGGGQKREGEESGIYDEEVCRCSEGIALAKRNEAIEEKCCCYRNLMLLRPSSFLRELLLLLPVFLFTVLSAAAAF